MNVASMSMLKKTGAGIATVSPNIIYGSSRNVKNMSKGFPSF